MLDKIRNKVLVLVEEGHSLLNEKDKLFAAGRHSASGMDLSASPVDERDSGALYTR